MSMTWKYRRFEEIFSVVAPQVVIMHYWPNVRGTRWSSGWIPPGKTRNAQLLCFRRCQLRQKWQPSVKPVRKISSTCHFFQFQCSCPFSKRQLLIEPKASLCQSLLHVNYLKWRSRPHCYISMDQYNDVIVWCKDKSRGASQVQRMT